MKSFIIVDNQSTKGRTGIQSVIYAYDGIVRITYTYDFMDCRATKKVETISTNPGTGERETIIILHQRFLYRGYLQIAACDLTSEGSPKLWHILWDPTQNVATRPLAIQQDDTWYCYGWDLTKNICELFQSDGSIGATYAYAPFGEVTATGAVTQPFQWSSEYHDTELAMVYYNYRYYNSTDGRWVLLDYIYSHHNLYLAYDNSPMGVVDYIGLAIHKFEYELRERDEVGGTSLRGGNVEEIAEDVAKFAGQKKLYNKIQALARIAIPSVNGLGEQYRIFIMYKCECDDGYTWFNLCASKPYIKTDHFVINPKTLRNSHWKGFLPRMR